MSGANRPAGFPHVGAERTSLGPPLSPLPARGKYKEKTLAVVLTHMPRQTSVRRAKRLR